ncbi:MAG: hypothetical protein GY898_13400 [Proteobacteria bacterium]|nr:hypothetical protein [Pseudomonadota bacterium]
MSEINLPGLDPETVDESAKVAASGCLLTAYGGFLACFPLALLGGLVGVVFLYFWVAGKVGA